MKSFIILATLLSTSAHAAATLKIPFFVEENNQTIAVSKINARYNLQGADKLTEVLVVDSTLESIRAAREIYWQTHAKVDELSQKHNADFYLTSDNPGYRTDGKVRTCYSGSVDDAVELAGNLTDSVYSDQMGIWGYKYKKQTTLLEGQDADETLTYLNEQSAIWKNWKSTNDDILVLIHEGDDGTDVSEGILVKCK